MNRILAAINRASLAINQKGLSPEKLASASKSMDMGMTEYCRFQELKSLGSLNGKLTLDEAMTVYGYLGNTPEHFNGQPLAVKYALTVLFAELLRP